ncbi:uncharacterized protein DNG_06089 [Cephalotrichum gorgonifer]|uniref:Chorismate synthase protein n=1 Tax=Cephalotrichum gorgonifer TaxID=2041049 RepID=A0AAE8SW37_9PEZI|nr:uncharacterized protein DNG_06089 [Cephalotrichum gorgonifer]
MSSTWSNVKSIVIFFGPIVLPKAIAFYRKARSAPRQQGLAIQPVPAAASRALAVLLATAVLLLIAALPVFAPENLFVSTQSRLQIPPDVLFNRLATLRPGNVLTAADETLRARFASLDSRLLYLKYGPEVVAGCTFCTSDDPRVYFFYALPAILTPHLLNLFILAVAASPLASGRYGAPIRKPATMAAVALAALDLYLLDSQSHKDNARALRLSEIDFFHWRTRVYRLLALAALDCVAAAYVYLSSTNRAFAEPPGPSDRAEAIISVLSRTRGKLNALGTVVNTVSRDEELRKRSAAYWVQEGSIMRGVMEEREVVESVNDALENGRINVESIERDAAAYAENITSALRWEGEDQKSR